MHGIREEVFIHCGDLRCNRKGNPFVKWNPRRQSKLLLQIKPVGSDRAVVTHADMSMMIELACAHMADRLAQLSSEFSGTPGNETVR